MNKKDKEQIRQRGIVLTYGELYYIFAAIDATEFMNRVWQIFTEHIEKIINYHEVSGTEVDNE